MLSTELEPMKRFVYWLLQTIVCEVSWDKNRFVVLITLIATTIERFSNLDESDVELGKSVESVIFVDDELQALPPLGSEDSIFGEVRSPRQ